MPIKAILFDIDGTLVDSNDLHVLAWQQAFAGIGAHFDHQTLHDQIGKGTDKLVPALLPDLPKAEQKKLGETHGAIFKGRYIDQVKPFPCAHDMLARARASGFRLALASSASKDELEHYLGLLLAHDMIEASTGSDDVKKTKPAPDIFSTALSKLPGISREEAFVIGDTPYDMEAARSCGIPAIGLRSGKFTDTALKEAGAGAIYDDVASLLADYDQSPLGLGGRDTCMRST